MATDQSTEQDWKELERELLDEADFKDDWVQYTYETFGADSPEYQATKIKTS